jgi:1-Cys peroxiredoxin 6
VSGRAWANRFAHAEGRAPYWHPPIAPPLNLLPPLPPNTPPPRAVCTTELGEAAIRVADFTSRGVKIIALSCDSVEDHHGWVKDIAAANGGAEVTYPIISDPTRKIAAQLGMLDEEEMDAPGLPATVRKVFVIGPDRKVKLQLIYPTAVGRNFDEIIRVIDALQLAAKYPIATPVNWTKGHKVMIQPSVSDADAEAKFPGFERTAVPSGKGYIRMTAGAADGTKF